MRNIFIVCLLAFACTKETPSSNSKIIYVANESYAALKIKYFELIQAKSNLVELVTASKLLVNRQRFYLLDSEFSKSISILDLEGNLLSIYQRHGNGPGEYKEVYDFTWDEQNHEIYLLCEGDKVIVLDEQLNFKREFKNKIFADQFISIGDFLYYSTNLTDMNNVSASILKVQKNELSGKADGILPFDSKSSPPALEINKNFANDFQNNKWWFTTVYDPTIYSIEANSGNTKPEFTFVFKNKEWNHAPSQLRDRKAFFTYVNEAGIPFAFSSITPFGDKIIFYTVNGGSPEFYVVDTLNETCKKIKFLDNEYTHELFRIGSLFYLTSDEIDNLYCFIDSELFQQLLIKYPQLSKLLFQGKKDYDGVVILKFQIEFAHD
jgi:hypothetical protein